MYGFLPNKIVLQWHITDRCNYRCRHCYQDGYEGTELDYASLTGILAQFKDLLARVAELKGGRRVRGHVTITGGEPYVRSDFPRLLEHLSENRAWTSFGVLTNGSFIDRSAARELKRLRASFVQISIEGSRLTHDRIRGAGTYDSAVCALEHLAKAGVRTLISFTAHQGNYREFPDVVKLGRRLKVWKVWADRVIPQGSGHALAGQGLDQETTRRFIEIMHASQEAERARFFRRTEVAMDRALQFLINGGKPYTCQAGGGLITVMPDASLYPCRRMPVSVGNILDTPLSNLYFENDLLTSLRNASRVSEGCECCLYKHACRGGLRCLSYAVKGDPFTADPGCWRATPAVRQELPAQIQEVSA